MAQAVAVEGVMDSQKSRKCSSTIEKEEEGESTEEQEQEEEYVPVDAMFRDELDVGAADGSSVRAYTYSAAHLVKMQGQGCVDGTCHRLTHSLAYATLAAQHSSFVHSFLRCVRTWCRRSWRRSSGGGRSGP